MFCGEQHVFHVFVQLAVKDLQDTIQFMHENKKYKRVSRCLLAAATGAFIHSFSFFFIDLHSQDRTHMR